MNDDLELKPHNINPIWWWYEESGGICVVHGVGGNASENMVNIPWRSIRAALRRKDKPAQKFARKAKKISR